MPNDEEVMQQWSAAAGFWEKNRDVIRTMFAPVTEALIEDAGIGAGDAVLDIATGPGEPALTVAAVVGPEGRVTGVDLVPGMVSAARAAAARLGVRNAGFEAGSAEELPFAGETFDAAISRFGVMFFPAPVQAVREMLRVLKPGGRLALAVWHFEAENPYFSVLSGVLDRYVEAPPVRPDAAEPFRFATPGKLLRTVEEAGAADARERLLHFRIEAPLAAEEFWAVRCEMSEKLREKVEQLSGEQLAEAKREAFERLRPYSAGGRMSFPAQVLMVSGVKR